MSSRVPCVQEGSTNLIPDALCFLVTAHLTRALTLLYFTSWFHSVRVPEKGISHDPQHLSCENSSSTPASPSEAGNVEYNAHDNRYRQKNIWRINSRLQIQIPGFLRISFRYRRRSRNFENKFPMRSQKGFVHFQNRDLREGQTRTWRRGRERARQREKRPWRKSRCLGAPNHFLRGDENGRGWLGPAVARMAPQCGIGASTTVEVGPGRSPGVNS